MNTGIVVLEFLNMGGSEIMLILAVVLLLFGGKKLPELARGLGKGIRDFKDASEGVKREIHRNINAMDIDDEIKATDAAYPATPRSGTEAHDANSSVHIDPSAPTAVHTETPVVAHTETAAVAHTETSTAAHIETPAGETLSEIEKNKI
ncbi:sec-independent protein translocase protein TatA [Pedobacter cryoconitis]|uniref:Sec-independent protein translocase protein TatA n=1 Tax=Pedobacter cryoconitis TaxID=188932 RepID=A0A7W9DZS6_9SPHI|nr:twin-arginine translocase TatA/TatE family subunit [Pedobacter cryoconitis]MBB5636549.1 sec-independent protein translocase protein TatA [Pedobacter cryoconitis]